MIAINEAGYLRDSLSSEVREALAHAYGYNENITIKRLRS